MSAAASTRGAGRPRKENTERDVMAVVRDLVRARGYDAVTVNLIAAQAGVAKQTLYRRWPGKAEIVLDAFLEGTVPYDAASYDGLVSTLTSFLTSVFEYLAVDGASMRSLIASAQSDPAFMGQLHTRFVMPRAEIMHAILREAVTRKELPATADVDVLTDMVHGACWYRLLTGQRLDADYAAVLARQVGQLHGGSR